MKVSYGQMAQVTLLAEAAGRNGVKHLSSAERKAVAAMTDAIENKEKGGLTITKFREVDFNKLVSHLKDQIGSTVVKAHSSALMQLIKGLANRLGRVSSQRLSENISSAHLALDRDSAEVPEYHALKPRLDTIKKLILPIVDRQHKINQHCENIKEYFLKFCAHVLFSKEETQKEKFETILKPQIDKELKAILKLFIEPKELEQLLQKLKAAGIPSDEFANFIGEYKSSIARLADSLADEPRKAETISDFNHEIDSIRSQIEELNKKIIKFSKVIILESKPTQQEKGWISSLLGMAFS